MGGDGYKYLKPSNAAAYGEFLGRRYGHRPHVFWILGGDNTPDTEEKREVWHRMARGIAIGTAGSEDYGGTLMTYHINGGASSSQWFHSAPWLDANMTQVWGDETSIPLAIARDYAMTPAKPVILGEGSYEDGPQYPTKPIDARQIRRQAYWTYLSGGMHTYGNTNTWNFGSYAGEATEDWKRALQSPGAANLTVLKKILHSVKWWELFPDPAGTAQDAKGETDPVGNASSPKLPRVASRSTDGTRFLAYLPEPGSLFVRRNRLGTGDMSRAVWIDPRDGKRLEAKPARDDNAAGRRFVSPAGWPDSLLWIETERRGAAGRDGKG